ncbi:hypothetical protein [Desulfobacula sp.]|uniref:hypothetical protein n=1 Tax=Desulfobacula sp. TaxID=2593537 RepID=UPI002601B85C|nr:hypothetical protein [Desulfobacula sp.]
MNEQLMKVLEHINITYRDKAMSGARNYLNVDIGKVALELGFKTLHKKYLKREGVVALKDPQPGMKVRIDGRTFVNYAEYANGLAVPEYIAKTANLPFTQYTANDSMILNFV